ncbi:MAG: N-acetyl-gamma-glutamyl-phosphate reductase [Methylobacteriaceae bacterium]|jgi:N-acetyl-gamma-glutamyl-phosphate reductase|nr:N-acetyl-gamma-glutamyl-phosphate reductase [Methylobacteriaceae bacterium]
MVAKVFIDGEAGTTGLEIREKLAGRRDIDIVSIAAERRKDKDAKRELLTQVDAVVLCLPDEGAKEAAELVDALGDAGPKLLDASTAHRVAPGWTYGFPELTKEQPDAIASARRVANPGCYATGAIALLRPLIDAALIPVDHRLTINAVSGYSGGGRRMIEQFESDHSPIFEVYGLGLEHKHIPEIVVHSRLIARPIFIPSVGNFRQGMIVCIPLFVDTLPGRPNGAAFRDALAAHYADAEDIHVVEPVASGRVSALTFNKTNAMELSVYENEIRGETVLVARLDNLGKGASGAAVQNLELMLRV